MSHGERTLQTLTSDNKVAVACQVVQRYVHAGRRRPFYLIVVFCSPVQLCHAVCESVWAEQTCVPPGGQSVKPDCSAAAPSQALC